MDQITVSRNNRLLARSRKAKRVEGVWDLFALSKTKRDARTRRIVWVGFVLSTDNSRRNIGGVARKAFGAIARQRGPLAYTTTLANSRVKLKWVIGISGVHVHNLAVLAR